MLLMLSRPLQRGGTDPSDPSDRGDLASDRRELASIRDASGRRSDANSRPIGREIDANSRPIDATDATDAAGHGENGGLAVVSTPKVSSTARIATGHCPVYVVSMHMLRLGPKPNFESGLVLPIESWKFLCVHDRRDPP